MSGGRSKKPRSQELAIAALLSEPTRAAHVGRLLPDLRSDGRRRTAPCDEAEPRGRTGAVQDSRARRSVRAFGRRTRPEAERAAVPRPGIAADASGDFSHL